MAPELRAQIMAEYFPDDQISHVRNLPVQLGDRGADRESACSRPSGCSENARNPQRPQFWGRWNVGDIPGRERRGAFGGVNQPSIPNDWLISEKSSRNERLHRSPDSRPHTIQEIAR